MADFIMVGLFIIFPFLMVGLISWAEKVITQGSDDH